MGHERQKEGVEVGLYLPGVQAVQTPSFNVDPANVVASTAEALLKPTPIEQVALVMLRHVDSFWY